MVSHATTARKFGGWLVPMLMVANYAGALVESPVVPHVGWRVGAYVGRSCAVMPSLAYGTSDMPDSAALADAAPYVDDPAMRCFASRLRRREPLRIAPSTEVDLA